MCKETMLPLADDKGNPVRWRKYGPNDRTPLPRDGKTARDKASGAWYNRFDNRSIHAEGKLAAKRGKRR
jgi:hypothetical protein